MRKNLIFLLIAVFSLSCSRFNRVMKMQEFEPKYEAANEYFEKEDYFRAGQIFEDLVSISMGRPEAEDLQFKYAYCFFFQNQYLLSAHYFKQFYDTYGRSLKAEEALYLYAKSMYLDTPKFNLDQSNTNKAIVALQDFLNKYPTSEYAKEATDYIFDLRKKLEMKAFSVAKQYQKLRSYKAALIAYDNFVKDFPDSKLKEEVYFRRIETEYQLAKISIRSLQEERYREAANFFQKFVDRYPQSSLLKDAERLYSDIQEDLKKVLETQEAGASVK